MILLTSLLAATPASAHRPLVSGVSCADDFSSSRTALVIPDPTISWFFNHYVDCNHRAVWLSFKNAEDDSVFYIGAGIVPAERFRDIRPSAVILGPGLPKLSEAEIARIPDEVKEDPAFADGNGILVEAPQDQTNCDHLTDIMTEHSSVIDGRCTFYEKYTHTNSWWTLEADDNIIPKGGEQYFVAVWAQTAGRGKLQIAAGTWAEDFRTPHEGYPKVGSCPGKHNVYMEQPATAESATQSLDFPGGACNGEPIQARIPERGGDLPTDQVGSEKFSHDENHKEYHETLELERAVKSVTSQKKSTAAVVGRVVAYALIIATATI